MFRQLHPLFIVIACFGIFGKTTLLQAEGLVLDTVVASIDGKPITLHDIEARLGRSEPLTAETAAQDPRIRFVLDEMIAQRLIEAECERRKLRVAPEDVDSYVDEIAKRNNMTLESFSAALGKEGKTLQQYRDKIRLDMLRGKLTNDMMRAIPPASDAEVRKYLKAHPELEKPGTHVALRQILVSTEKHPIPVAEQRMGEIQRRLAAGVAFEDLARQFSDGPEAEIGGSLGILISEDLAEPIQNVITGLPAQQLSSVLRSEAGYHLFWIDERLTITKASKKEISEKVRTLLEKQKLATKMEEFFSKDIYERHAVEKKL